MTFGPREEKAWVDIIKVCKYLKGGCNESEARLFSVPGQEAMGTNGNTGSSIEMVLGNLFLVALLEHGV